MNVLCRWVNQKDHITPPAPVFHRRIRIIRWTKNALRLLLEKRAFGRWSGILIVTNSARRGQREGRRGRGGLPLLYHAINITLHESYEFRAFAEGVDDPFVSGRRADFVAINMLDCVTDCTFVNFITSVYSLLNIDGEIAWNIKVRI